MSIIIQNHKHNEIKHQQLNSQHYYATLYALFAKKNSYKAAQWGYFVYLYNEIDILR